MLKFSAVLIILKQVIKVVRKRYERHQARKMKRLKEIPVDTEMARISLWLLVYNELINTFFIVNVNNHQAARVQNYSNLPFHMVPLPSLYRWNRCASQRGLELKRSVLQTFFVNFNFCDWKSYLKLEKWKRSFQTVWLIQFNFWLGLLYSPANTKSDQILNKKCNRKNIFLETTRLKKRPLSQRLFG